MSRSLTHRETDTFEDRYGYSPTSFAVARDRVVVFVHKSNPLRAVSLEQIDAIFSKTRRCGSAGDISTWGQLGLDGPWRTAPISLYGRNAASGTYGFFKNRALCGGDYKDSVKEQPGSASVVQGVEKDLYGVGYSGIGYTTSGVRALPLTTAEGTSTIEPTSQNAASGTYPLGRFLHVYVNRPPGRSLDRLTTEFLRFMLSHQGQRVVQKAGFDPISAEMARDQLRQISN
jgi:phosphate transport system substrate-binding protein